MSKPVFSDLFRLSGRRNRKSFILLFVAYVAALYPLIIIDLPDRLPVIFWIIFYSLSGPYWVAGAQRLRDLGWAGVTVWLLPGLGTLSVLSQHKIVSFPEFIILGISLVMALFTFGLMIVRGTRGPNKYGPDPLAVPKEASEST